MTRPTGWLKELTERSPRIAPGAPPTRRSIEREFWRQVAVGLSLEDAAVAVETDAGSGDD